MKNSGCQINTTEASFTNRVQDMEERISGLEDRRNNSIKENVK